MEFLISFMLMTNVMLAVLLVVVTMAKVDRTYAAKVRSEYRRKSLLRGEERDDDRF